MELDEDLGDALTYLDEPTRKAAMAHLDEAKDDPTEWAVRRSLIMWQAEEAAGKLASERRRLQARRMMEQAGAKPSIPGSDDKL